MSQGCVCVCVSVCAQVCVSASLSVCPSVRAQVRGGSLGGLETIKPSGCAEHGVIHLRDNKERREEKVAERVAPRQKRANGWKMRRNVRATGRQIG